MAITRDKTYLVYNYSRSPVSLFIREGLPSYLFEGGTRESPATLPLTIDEIISANSNGGAFKNGLLFFEPEHEADIYKELRIKDYKRILKDWEIEDIILHPTLEGMKLLISITNDTYFQRIVGCYTVLKNIYADIPPQSKYILDARIDEYRNHKRVSEINISEIQMPEVKVQQLTKQLEDLQKELEKVRAERDVLAAKQDNTKKTTQGKSKTDTKGEA